MKFHPELVSLEVLLRDSDLAYLGDVADKKSEVSVYRGLLRPQDRDEVDSTAWELGRMTSQNVVTLVAKGGNVKHPSEK